MFLLGFVKLSVVPIVKIIYADPRPYLLEPRIQQFKCALCFANPSGHAFASSLAVVAPFLDLFHGTPTSSKTLLWTRGRCNFLYWPLFIFSLYWVITLPYSRYIGGMHTLNQLLFGATLGVYCAVVAHLLFRDRILRTFEALFDERRALTEEEEAAETSTQDSTLGLREQARQGIKRGEYRDIGTRTLKLAILFSIVLVIVCIVIYQFQKDSLVEGKEPMLTYKKNFETNSVCSKTKHK